MTVRVKIKAGDYGMTYTFTLEDVDYSTGSGYTVTLWVWKADTVLIDGHATTSSIYAGGDTTIIYTVASGDFPTTSLGIWNAEFKFVKTSYLERTETFEWEVLDAAS